MNKISIKTKNEIERMRIAGRLASQVLDYLAPFVQVGVTTNYLDKLCHDYIVNVQKAYPAPLNYVIGRGVPPYPKSCCISINDEVCHGIPSGRIILDGDIVNIDVTVKKDGYHGDNCRMFYAGTVSAEAKKLCEITFEAMHKGIEQVKPGNFFGDIGHAIESFVKTHGYSVVREFCGHGIGTRFHEPPNVLHYGNPKTYARLKAGMAFTIEPMINQGARHITVCDRDGWTVRTADHSLSAQWEHTILVTDTGFEILTVS